MPDKCDQRSSGASAVKSQPRFVRRTEWELPMRGAKPYWEEILNKIEADHRKVNDSLYSIIPNSSSTIPHKTSASNNVDSFSEFANLDDKKMNEPIVKISPPSPSHNEIDSASLEKTSVIDSIEFLKRHDFSNFNLDLQQENVEREDKPEDIGNSEDGPVLHRETLPALSTIGKITQLTKISRYVNDFLASTRIKVNATISPRNYVHPLRESPHEVSGDSNCIIEKRLIAQEGQTIGEKSRPEANVNETDVLNKWESIMSPGKSVASAGNIDCMEKTSRPRAPSLGVASLVPSFGKVISSIEYPESLDSRSSTESPQDDLQSADSLPIPRLMKEPEKPSRNLLNASPIRISGRSRYPQYEKTQKPGGHQYWSRKTIVHTIRALKAMRAGTKMRVKLQQEHNSFVSSPLPISSYYSSVGKSPSSSIDQDVLGKDVSTSGSSLKDSPEGMEVKTIHVDKVSGAWKPSSIIQKKHITIKDLPPIGGMYQRQRKNKCLACLYRWRPESEGNSVVPDGRSDSPLNSRTGISGFNEFLTARLIRRAKKLEIRDEPIDNADELSASVLSNQLDDARPVEKKISPSPVKDDLKSSKSFVSTLSLSSDHSRTISDQEDSDQGPNAMADTGDEIPGSGSKSRAPCHAPLNLKPSLEPLMALRGKKSKSIQSRVASLEKSIDEESEGEMEAEEDDDDENIVGKVKETEVRKVLPKPTEIESSTLLKVETKEKLREVLLDREKEFLQKRAASVRSDGVAGERSVEAPSLSEEIYNQLNVRFRVTEHNPSQSFRPLSPIMPDWEVMEIAEGALNEDKSIKDILQLLVREYSDRLASKLSNDKVSADRNVKKIEKITNHLLALLVDAKLYLNPEFVSSNLEFSSKQKPYCSSQQLRRFLPFKSYNLIAPILGMPEWYPKRWSAIKSARSLKFSLKPKKVTMRSYSSSDTSASAKTESLTDFDLIVHPPSTRESQLSEVVQTKKSKKINPYATFLTKPRRKAVIWRPLIERDFEGYDPESTLKNRAARVTDKICKDFCDWLRSLGGSQNAIDEVTLKDMFETDFSAEACRTLQVAIREMPAVPTVVAAMRHCPEYGKPEVTKRKIIRDVKAERRPRKVIGFETTVPNHLRYEPPNNNVHAEWIECSSVPQDLETMSFVWKNITKLESVKGFSNWLETQPNVKLPKGLPKMRKKSLGRKF